MLSCFSFRWSLLLVFLGIFAGGTTMVSCKKKSKKKGGQDAPKEEEVKKPDENKEEIVYGQEVVEGDSMVFRDKDLVSFIRAVPYKASPNQKIAFEGNCGPKNEGVITWNFGDQEGSSAQAIMGAKVEHAYAAANSYKVTANCAYGSTQVQQTLTIAISNAVLSPNDPNSTPSQNGCYPNDCVDHSERPGQQTGPYRQ
jgi:signal peptidase I